MICTWSGWCRCHPIVSCLIEIQNGSLFLVFLQDVHCCGASSVLILPDYLYLQLIFDFHSYSRLGKIPQMRISGVVFLQSRCPSCHPTESVKEVKEEQCIIDDVLLLCPGQRATKCVCNVHACVHACVCVSVRVRVCCYYRLDVSDQLMWWHLLITMTMIMMKVIS